MAGAKPPIVDTETGEELDAQASADDEVVSETDSNAESEGEVEVVEEADESDEESSEK